MSTSRHLKSLKVGSTIGIVAPAGQPDKHKLKKATDYLRLTGYQVVYGDAVLHKHGYLAGADEDRAADINTMFQRRDIDAIFCACGGYGSPRIASLLNYNLIKKHPKIFWGYSDITFLHVAIHQLTALTTFHGPMLSSDLGIETRREELNELLFWLQSPATLTYQAVDSLVEGNAYGKLIGGNLSLLVNSLGTPYEVDTNDAVFFIEETDEEPYVIDRLLNQLKQAGKFSQASGILLGHFNDCFAKKGRPSFSLEEVFLHHIVPEGKPVLTGLNVGHCEPNYPMPIGAVCHINTYDKTVVIKNPFAS
ncbi:LD-carboxypeptidase [Salipaludibacillus sp. LMS25]|jgi:muramoyltetrapeptide carboxypeptidase|uniref:S66 peptidase family protein n=1 Tax=Salipaludibacillus sp. LMS25 TaxID=2924031 RepID=UPI0020D0E384|nr:LD-carboxypeptidase [Salipaludibacillus sp. LMS25]UTR13975.1 LD-carboxypeptidase [Salipaludibacillus sp. LMS25]